MPTTPRYLTKSRFKLGLGCPRKLYYVNKPEYPNKSLNDSFLKSLAEGGYQVGELAKYYYPGGIPVSTLDYDDAIAQTQELLERDEVTIYEAAIQYKNLFIRVDILRKHGNHLELIEVKAKSYDPDSDSFFNKKKTDITSTWKPYLQDLAFQCFVVRNALPAAQVDCFLLLADKSAKATTDGLNSKFRAVDDGSGRLSVTVSSPPTAEELASPLLVSVEANDAVQHIFSSQVLNEQGFENAISYLASLYERDDYGPGTFSKSTCRSCEFRCTPEEEQQGLIDGFKNCWDQEFNLEQEDHDTGLVLDIWNFRSADKCITQGKVRMTDIEIEDLLPKTKKDPTPTVLRQWMQIEKACDPDAAEHLDVAGLRAEMNSWRYPLHFIDFETSAMALPFTKGQTPYEQTAFQFSHHKVNEDGTIEHAGEFLDTTPGKWPNLDFVRALKAELEEDSGTIFRYHNHENTILLKILEQIASHKNVDSAERDELTAFIKSITHKGNDSSPEWRGDRDMVDMHRLVTSYYYHPLMKGSNSIKKVLPAILHSSKHLQEKYSKPIYGTQDGIKSLNFKDWAWVKVENGVVTDPYKLLPPVFEELDISFDEILSSNDALADGGAALTAYAKLQYTDMTDAERHALETALLRYCELDTFAMIMIYEAWASALADQQ